MPVNYVLTTEYTWKEGTLSEQVCRVPPLITKVHKGNGAVFREVDKINGIHCRNNNVLALSSSGHM